MYQRFVGAVRPIGLFHDWRRSSVLNLSFLFHLHRAILTRGIFKSMAVTALLRWDNCARTRRVVHWSQSLRNQTQWTALDICAAKQRLLHDLPPPKKKTKRNRPDNCSVPIAACHRATGVAPITSTATVLPVLPSSSSSEDDDGDSDDSNDSDSNEKRQFSNKRYYYRNYPPYLVIFLPWIYTVQSL